MQDKMSAESTEKTDIKPSELTEKVGQEIVGENARQRLNSGSENSGVREKAET